MLQAETRLDEAIQAARPAMRAVLETLRELASEEHVVEFGIKLNAEAGVVVAKTPAEGHFIVKIIWRRDYVGGVTMVWRSSSRGGWTSGRGHGIEVQTVRADTLVVEANVVSMSDGHTKLADRRGHTSPKAQVRGRPR